VEVQMLSVSASDGEIRREGEEKDEEEDEKEGG
jgi:hypothetical protein